jgi:hypothetical protein
MSSRLHTSANLCVATPDEGALVRHDFPGIDGIEISEQV